MSDEQMNETIGEPAPRPESSLKPRSDFQDLQRYAVVERIRRLASQENGLFRVHATHGGLYARARRLFGTWAAAVRAADLDYDTTMYIARQRASASRKRRRNRAPLG